MTHIIPQITLNDEEFERLQNYADHLGVTAWEAVKRLIRGAPLHPRNIQQAIAPDLEVKDESELEGKAGGSRRHRKTEAGAG